MNSVTSVSLSLPWTWRTHYPVNMLGTPRGKRRPRGALPQAVVDLRLMMQSVSRSRYVFPSGGGIGELVTLLFVDCKSYSSARRRTAAAGRFDWGGTPSIKKQRRSKVNSSASEMHCRGSKTNVGLTVFLTKWDAETKVGLNEQ